jgi:TolB-like protein
MIRFRCGFRALLLLMMVAGTAVAQAQPKRVPTVAVLEFGVVPLSGSPAILGRSATDAVVLEITRTGRFDSVPRAQLEQQIKASDLSLPLSGNDIQRLGQALGADYIAYGEVTEIAFSEKPRRARVTLSVRLTDVLTGELANGAIQTGSSSAKPADLEDDALIQQAISDAAFSIVRSLNNYRPLEATVLLARGGTEVTLNQGSRDGIRKGQEMVVIRGTRYVGRIRVSSVGDTDSRADVVDGGNGIRPEDRAKAVFKMPGLTKRR